MNAQLKGLYLAQIGLDAFPYAAANSAQDRLWGVFRTSNLLRFPARQFFPTPANPLAMNSVWLLLGPVAAEPAGIPNTRAVFDGWLKDLVISTANAYAPAPPHPLGIAQKTVNLFLKDLWALNRLTPAQEECLHAPIDSTIYEKVANAPPSWKHWTSVKWDDAVEFHDLWTDYLRLQTAIQGRATSLTTPGLTMYPIMLEQLLWGAL